jgi:hypothetical protein
MCRGKNQTLVEIEEEEEEEEEGKALHMTTEVSSWNDRRFELVLYNK